MSGAPYSSQPSAKERERAKEIERVLGVLQQWGIHTLGQLAALPREQITQRLGALAAKLWDRARGCSERPLRLVAPPESFCESFEFENEIETSEPLLFMLRRFLQQLGRRLHAIYLVAGELHLRLIFADKSDYVRVFKIPQPTNDEEILFRMLHTHLENFSSPQPIVAVELEAKPSRPARQQFGLFETALRDPAQLHATLARLIGLLGSDRVGTPVLEESHRPDAFRMEPFVWELPVAPTNAPPPRLALRRFRKRKAATVLLENSQPAHVRAVGLEGATTAHAGPFPLSGNWWEEKAWARVEWDVALENGALLRCHRDRDGWTVDGLYD